MGEVREQLEIVVRQAVFLVDDRGALGLNADADAGSCEAGRTQA